MSLSANFPEEPWLRLSLGMESVQGGGAAESSVHPERLFAKSCYERRGAGTVRLARGRTDSGGNRSGICPGRSVQVPCFLFGFLGTAIHAVPCLFLKPSAVPETQKAKAVETRKEDSDYPSAKAGLENHQLSQMQPDLSDIRKHSTPDLHHNRHKQSFC